MASRSCQSNEKDQKYRQQVSVHIVVVLCISTNDSVITIAFKWKQLIGQETEINIICTVLDQGTINVSCVKQIISS